MMIGRREREQEDSKQELEQSKEKEVDWRIGEMCLCSASVANRKWKANFIDLSLKRKCECIDSKKLLELS